MATQSPSSSSSSFAYGFSFDVFISFRGTDTRFGFTGNLYKALSDKGIRTFIDDKELQRGEEITPSLLKSIEDSRIAIIVFSKDYASSSFCLDELVHIIHYFKEKGRLVLPVFYGTEPSHVRHQNDNDSYGEALAKFKERFQNHKQNMKRLLKWKIALKQAADLSGYHFNLGTEYEHKFIENIVKEVSDKINLVPLHVADYLVGLESRISEVNSLLDLGSNDGVCIMGILGTGGLGKTTLAEAVYNSNASQFEFKCFLHGVRENSVKHGLVYLQEQLLSKLIKVEEKFGHVHQGIPIIRRRLYQKKVLLILDDVDKLQQLEVLVGKPAWLGDGSKVIITTRDKHLLSSHGIEKIYEADGLNEEQALELLRMMALRSIKNDSNYESILKRAAKYASGLPLALKVVGSNLFGRSIEECESLLDKYERIPHEDIQKILKVSFDALDEEQQSVFLDIACFFKGCKLTYVEEMLHVRYGHCKKIDLTVLVDKSLIKIDTNYYNEHIVRLHDLIEDMGIEIVRQESPNKPGERSRLWFHDDIVKVLKEDMGTANIEMIHLHCPSMETVIEWNGTAFKKMTNLKTLIIKNGHFSKDPKYLPSSLRLFEWKGSTPESLSSCTLSKKFEEMKVLKFDDFQCLTHIPDVSGLQNLENFSFQHCKNLITIHNSIGYLNKLEILDAYGCNKVESFPPLQLPSLKELNLSNCESLKSFPELLCKMTNIKEIDLFFTSIVELPFSFQNLSELCHLTICTKSFKILPEFLSEFHNLRDLNVEYCGSLEEIRGIPPNLESLFANNCESLSSSSRRMLMSQKLHEAGGTQFCFLNKTEPIGIPDWFEYKSRGQSISFWFRKNIPSITCIILLPETQSDEISVMLCFNGYECTQTCLSSEQAYLFDLEEWCKTNLVCELNEALLNNEWIHFEIRLEDDEIWCESSSEDEEITLEFDSDRDDYGRYRKFKYSAEMGIHARKDKNNTEGNVILFTNPYRKRKLSEYLNTSLQGRRVSKREKLQRQYLAIVSGMQNLVLTETKENENHG